MSFPGASKHRRIKTVCWRTTDKQSSSSRAWSSTGGGGEDAIVTGYLSALLSTVHHLMLPMLSRDPILALFRV